tara:strand:- start:58 stop:1062 length:1005 start_codon:yes stop_codon:yes gene_type:complete
LGDVREQPVQRMGFDFDEFDRLISEGTSEAEQHPWDLVEDPETGELVERGSTGRGRASHPGFNLPEVVATAIEGMGEWQRWDEADWEAVHAGIMDEILESGTPMEDPSDLVWDEIEAQLTPPDVEEREWGEDRSVGLSARDRALVQSPLAMAGGGQESLPAMSPEEIAREAQRKINREGLAGARRALEQGPSRVPDHLDDFVPDEDYGGVLEARRESSPLGWLGGRAAEWEGRQTYEPGPSKRDYPGAPLTPREPVGDPQSQMSQTMLADMFAQQAAQPQQGYFGGLGQAVGGMSTEQKIALLVGLGLIPMTGGASSSMMGPALGIGAGLAATQ